MNRLNAIRVADKLHAIFQKNRDVDAFTKRTGGVAAVFKRVENDFLCISTTLKDENGHRATLTKLDRLGPVHQALIDGRSFVGIVELFSKKYFAKYAPDITDNGNVLIAVFVAMPLDEQNKKNKYDIERYNDINDTNYSDNREHNHHKDESHKKHDKDVKKHNKNNKDKNTEYKWMKDNDSMYNINTWSLALARKMNLP